MNEITLKVANLSEVSDGYHTIQELYDHRCLLFINLCLLQPSKCFWKKDHYQGWDCLYLGTENGQISYHIPSKYRVTFQNKIKLDETKPFDGHTSNDVLERLEKLTGI